MAAMACKSVLNVDNDTASPYKSLKKMIAAEKKRLQAADLSMRESVSFNGKSDTVRMQRRSSDSATLEYLFKSFIDADITKPSLNGQYSSNEIVNNITGDSTFIYLAKGKQSRPKEIMLEVDSSGNFRSVKVVSSIKNLIYEYNQSLFYERNKVVRIYITQKVLFMNPSEMNVLVQFQ